VRLLRDQGLRGKPARKVRLFEDDRHAVMDLLGLLTCRCCYYGGGPVRFLCIFPEASKADGLPIAPGDVKGLLWATWTFLPLVVTGCGHDAAAAFKGIAEGWFTGESFRSRVDQEGEFIPRPGPEGNKPPSQFDELAFSVFR